MSKRLWVVIICGVLLVACTADAPPIANVTVTATATVALLDTAAPPPAAPIITATPSPPPTATSNPLPMATVTITATPDPLYPYTIAGLRADTYEGGAIQVREVQAQTAVFTQSYIDYPSDGLTVTGLMYVPVGTGPFPVIILLHGYLDRERYWSGWGTWQAAEYFAQHGYIALAPDLRSWGESDSGPSLFQTGLVRDVLNLISSLESIPQADSARVGLWGHSMGGGIATKVVTVDERVSAAVLYAPNSADDADIIGRWGAACLLGQAQSTGDSCNPSEVLPVGASSELVESYFAAAADPVLLQPIAPIYHLELIQAPVQIHIGSADGQEFSGTPPEWSAKLYAGLQAAGREVAYYYYEGEGHFFSGSNWNLMLEQALALYERTLR